MINEELEQRLIAYRFQHRINNKGALSVTLHVTRVARNQGLPLDPATLRTVEQGQVRGLSRSAVQAILQDYNIFRTLANEGGRTSRGSLGNMERYIEFLNQLHVDGLADLLFVEKWWVERVLEYFASQPFTLHYDASRSLRAMISDLLDQAKKRQEENPGTTYVGSVLQHLVGAKLELVLAGKNIELIHHGASVADAPTARAGDFIIKRVVIHVTTSPTQMLMRKCKENLSAGFKPIIVTVQNRVVGAEDNAEYEGIADRVEILAAEQFFATNLYELSEFGDIEQNTTLETLVSVYNTLIDRYETDPSLRISIGK